MTPHPRLSRRVDAVVRVHIKEVAGGLPAEHSIDMRLRVSVERGDHADRVKEMLLAKAAKILRSVKSALESTSGELVSPASVPAQVPEQKVYQAQEQAQLDSLDQNEELPDLAVDEP